MGDSDTAGSQRAAQSLRAQLGLRQLILEGGLRAGERVAEVAVARQLGVSRTPIRAALARLAEEGLLEPAGLRGYVVRRFSAEEACDAIELRGLLEGAAARRAAERAPGAAALAPMRDGVLAMDALVQRNRLAPADFDDFVRLNGQFHDHLVALACSSVIERAVARITALPFASASAFLAAQATLPDAHATLRTAQAQHRRILAAIAAGDGDAAEHATREHSTLARRNLGAVMRREAPLRKVLGGNLIELPAVRRR